jgi:hypothetical protein
MVNDIQKLSGQSMLIFYTYGDDLINAKFPGIVILMTLHLDYTIGVKQYNAFMQSSSKLNEFVENYLVKLWSKDIGDDQLRPLFTRIANNVVLINREEDYLKRV